jgi:hypothetical protein
MVHPDLGRGGEIVDVDSPDEDLATFLAANRIQACPWH